MWRFLAITFASGFAALTYEVVWLSILSTVVGGTTVAASATLAVFFLGLGSGALFGARLAERTHTPLRLCAAVELTIAACAGAFLLLLGPVSELHRSLYVSIGYGATILVALLLLWLPSALMGMTIPLIGEVAVREVSQLGRKGSLIYASNTLGGALGASLSAFWLIAELGIAGTCAVAALLNVGAAGLLTTVRVESRATREERPPSKVSRPAILLAAVSGYLMLSLEVLWTRMLVQVVHNSVYTFGAILLVFLVSLGTGSWLAAIAMRFDWVRKAVEESAAIVAVVTMMAVFWSAHSFGWMTDGYQRLTGQEGLGVYVGHVIAISAATFVPGAVIGGMLFPLSLQLAGPHAQSGGRGLGILGAANTLAAIMGSLTAGFVLVKSPFGLFNGLAWIAGGYGLLALFVTKRSTWRAHAVRGGVGLAAAALIGVTVKLPPPIALRPRERVLDLQEGVGGIVAVTESPGNRKIKVNNHYTLGSTRGKRYQLRQGIVPVLLHPNPERVFFIGLGTGITSSAALLFDEVESLTVAELTPEVVELSREHFATRVHGLYSDPRAEVVAGDARHHLATHDQQYDVVVGDLFVPWRAGAGNLYSRDHFEVVRSRLRPGGVFAQWLPLYQMSRFELGVIAKTMMATFGELEVWRCEFQPERTILALVARVPGPNSLDPAELALRVDKLESRHRGTAPPWMRGYGFFELHAGVLTPDHELVAGSALNTDRHPVIAYQAPRTHGASLGGRPAWLAGDGYLALLRDLSRNVAPMLDAEAKKQARAGLLFHERAIHEKHKNPEAMRRAEQEYRALKGQLNSTWR